MPHVNTALVNDAALVNNAALVDNPAFLDENAFLDKPVPVVKVALLAITNLADVGRTRRRSP
jgi:hypothetical protein